MAALGAILLLGIIVYIYKQSSATFRKGDRVIVHKAMGTIATAISVLTVARISQLNQITARAPPPVHHADLWTDRRMIRSSS